MCLFAKKYSDIKLPLPLPKSYQESRDIKWYYGQKCIYVLMKHIHSAPSNFNTEVTLLEIQILTKSFKIVRSVKNSRISYFNCCSVGSIEVGIK